MTSNDELLRNVERIRAETAVEYARKLHIDPRAFVLSGGTEPVRIDPDFSLDVDQSKAEFVRAIKQTVKRLNADAVLSVSESWLTKLSQQPTVIEVVLATLSQRHRRDTLWIATIERVDGEKPVLSEWTERYPESTVGMFFDLISKVN